MSTTPRDGGLRDAEVGERGGAVGGRGVGLNRAGTHRVEQPLAGASPTIEVSAVAAEQSLRGGIAGALHRGKGLAQEQDLVVGRVVDVVADAEVNLVVQGAWSMYGMTSSTQVCWPLEAGTL